MSSHPRRDFLRTLSILGAGSALLPRRLFAVPDDARNVTADMVKGCDWISGLTLSDEERALMLSQLGDEAEAFAKARAIAIDNGVLPALRFSPLSGGGEAPPARPARKPRLGNAARPATDTDLAFATVREQAALLRAKKISSVELTKLSLERLRRFDPTLLCVVTFTEDLAMEQARRADREIASGRWKGPLHGVPWAAKDLIAVPGYKTTWGSVPFKDQVRPEKATVVTRLEEAGAVLVAKTSVGELAWGDVWFGGTTKNPWKPDQGSSGSSAGSASATAAGLVAFALGTETLGSIVSPSTRCGVSGLRPTFGRVSRYGVMSLCPSMDKVGALARSIEDAALVVDAIGGRDPRDPYALGGGPVWPSNRKLSELKVGYPASLFEDDRSGQGKTEEEKARIKEGQELDRKALDAMKLLGVSLVPIKIPDRVPVGPLRVILTAEASATFDDLTRNGKTKTMVRQIADAWPNVFRLGELVPAVEYLRANRLRSLLMESMDELMKTVDVYISPTFAGDNLLLTNLTGHPQAVVPNGFRASDGTPTSITFTGRPFGEADLVTVAASYQEATGFHRRRPKIGG